MNDPQNLELYKERIIEYLASCYAKDILDMEDYERRVTLVNRAETAPAIDRIVSDLQVGDSNASDYRASDGNAYPAVSPDNKIVSILGERKLDGYALHGRYTTALSVMGSTRLDLRDYRPTEDVQIHLVAVMSEVVIIVPADMPVHNGVTPLLGEVSERNKRGGGSAYRRTGFGITLSGVAIMSELRIERV